MERISFTYEKWTRKKFARPNWHPRKILLLKSQKCPQNLLFNLEKYTIYLFGTKENIEKLLLLMFGTNPADGA